MSENFQPAKRAMRRAQDMDWLFANRAQLEEIHAGQWVAIEDGRLRGVGESLDEALEAARKDGASDPLVTSVKAKDIQGSYLIRTCR